MMSIADGEILKISRKKNGASQGFGGSMATVSSVHHGD